MGPAFSARFITSVIMPTTKVYASTLRLIRGYDGQQKEMPDIPAIYPAAGALRSNVTELLNFMDAQLKEADPVIRMTHWLAYSSAESSNGLPWAMGGTRAWDF